MTIKYIVLFTRTSNGIHNPPIVTQISCPFNLTRYHPRTHCGKMA